MLEIVNKKIGMATGWVQAKFLYARPVGLNPLPEPAPFNKWVFFPTQTHPAEPCGLHGPCPIMPSPDHNTNTNTDIKNTSFRSMTFPFKSQTQTQILTQIQTQIS